MPRASGIDAVGSFIWCELMTPDPDAANAFYGAVVGWRFIAGDGSGAASGVADLDYRMIRRDDGIDSGGVLKLTAAMQAGGAQPGWLPYRYVPDVDAASTAIVGEGGTRITPTMPIAAGTLALLADPQGVPIYLMTPSPPPGREAPHSDALDPVTPQHVRWNELASPDEDASMDFYHRHFGFGFEHRMAIRPQEVPGGTRIIVGTDPHGATFGLVGAKDT